MITRAETNLMLGNGRERNEVADATKEERADERKCEVGMLEGKGNRW